MARHHGLAGMRRARRVVEVRQGDRDAQHLFLAAAEDGQRAVRRHFPQRFGMVEIIGEFGAVLLLALDQPRGEMGVVPQMVANRPDQVGVLGEALGEDIARALQRGGGVGDALFRIHVWRRGLFRVPRRVGQQRVGQRLQSRLAGDRRPGAALRAVGKVKILQPRLAVGL